MSFATSDWSAASIRWRDRSRRPMTKRLHDLQSVLTSFAYRTEYFNEIDGMLVTVREHHPDWPTVTGRGPVSGCDLPTFEVEGPARKCRWTFPVALDLDGSENDWRKITKMKGWWMSQVWGEFGEIADSDSTRLVWVDADARLNGPLDVELDPEGEVIAGPWWDDPENPAHSTICSGLVVFQGSRHGIVRTIIDRWSSDCQSQVGNLPDPTVPWLDGDQEVLNGILQSLPPSDHGYTWLKLEHDRYAAYANKDGTPLAGALVDQWQMSRKMKFPECRDRDWPPPEMLRRRSAK